MGIWLCKVIWSISSDVMSTVLVTDLQLSATDLLFFDQAAHILPSLCCSFCSLSRLLIAVDSQEKCRRRMIFPFLPQKSSAGQRLACASRGTGRPPP